MSPRRKSGDSCLCTSHGHGHDDKQCGEPVYGRTHGGKLKRVCDHCSHVSRLHRLGQATLDEPRQDRVAIIEEAAGRGARTPQPIPARVDTPPAKPPAPLTDPIWKEPF